jgi:hypothetical protein
VGIKETKVSLVNVWFCRRFREYTAQDRREIIGDEKGRGILGTTNRDVSPKGRKEWSQGCRWKGATQGEERPQSFTQVQ